MSLKKLGALALIAALALPLGACSGGSDAPTKNANGKIVINKLNVAFVPSRDPQFITTTTGPLKELLKKQLDKEGYEVKDIAITVGTSFEAVGEGLEAGTVDVGFIPAGTYILYKNGAQVLLTATRNGLSVDSDNPKEWNEKKPIKKSDKMVSYYRALFVAGNTAKGKALAAKVNAGEKLSWEDVKDAKIGVANPTSPAGYIYPSIWFNEHFGKTLLDLGPNMVVNDNYGTAFGRLASGQLDALWTYADARLDQEKNWTEKFKQSESIWDATNLIGVTPKIANDTISVSKKSKTMTPEFNKAFAKAMIDIAKTPEGQKVIDVYSHKGYVMANEKDYEGEAKAQEFVKKLGKH